MTSTNLGAGTRFLGGLIGLSFDSADKSKVITNNSITVNGAVAMLLSSTTDNVAGGLFGRIADGTTCTGCSGEFKNELSIQNTGKTTGVKFVGGICANIINSRNAAAAILRTTTITVQSTVTLLIDTNEGNGNSRCGAMFGYVQDLSTASGGNTEASLCEATYNGSVSVKILNISSGNIYLGGIAATNQCSLLSGNILTLNNGITIDNLSTTNNNCFGGLIVGQSLTNILGNKAETLNNTVNIILWVFFGLFIVNTVGNIFAKTNFEKLFAILTGLSAILIWNIIKHKNTKNR
jgi:hypothetical protein